VDFMTVYRCHLFGSPSLATPTGELIPIRSRKSVGLLASLALAEGGPVGRDQLCDLLWPDRQAAQARASLRQLLVDVRRDLGLAGDVLDTRGDGLISFNPMAIVFDVGEFNRLRRADDQQSLEQAFALRRGQFIDGPAPRETTFAEWIDDSRRTLDNSWCEVTARLLRVLGRQDDHQQCLNVANRLLSVDPYCELAHQAVIRAHLALNNRSLALRHYQAFRETLDRELGVEPDPLTQQMIRDGSAHVPISNAPAQAPPPAPLARRPKASIAVLPFDSPDRDVDGLHFAEGLAEDLSTGLSRFADLAVIARTSVRAHVLSGADVPRPLDVDYLVRGSVRRADHRVRVTASLLHSTDGAVLWSERFDRDFRDVFALQDDIAQRLVAALAARVQAFELTKTLQKPVIDYQAYDMFLKARYLQASNSKEGILEARPLLKEAISREAAFASAYAELAMGYVTEYESDWCGDPETTAREALALAAKAVAVDPANSNSHRALAAAQLYCNRNFEAAKAHADAALIQNPNDQSTLCLLGLALTCNGHVAEGVHCSAESFKLTPLVPESCIYTIALGAYFEGNFADAVHGFARISGAYDEVHACLAAALWNLGKHDTAEAAMQRFMSLKLKKMTAYPGHDAQQWRSYLLRVIPVGDPASLEKLFDGFRRAGLPV
jgi:DNA-binding SARP family transcriptional activator